jgi:hypothetical protein
MTKLRELAADLPPHLRHHRHVLQHLHLAQAAELIQQALIKKKNYKINRCEESEYNNSNSNIMPSTRRPRGGLALAKCIILICV